MDVTINVKELDDNSNIPCSVSDDRNLRAFIKNAVGLLPEKTILNEVIPNTKFSHQITVNIVSNQTNNWTQHSSSQNNKLSVV